MGKEVVGLDIAVENGVPAVDEWKGWMIGKAMHDVVEVTEELVPVALKVEEVEVVVWLTDPTDQMAV